MDVQVGQPIDVAPASGGNTVIEVNTAVKP
jgi:hypothetical protein